jgi:hypothetical protein
MMVVVMCVDGGIAHILMVTRAFALASPALAGHEW